jgi:sec-independent protein translocase protein TatA
MSFGITELVIILVIVVLLFGTTKLKSLGTDLGSAIKGFRSAVSEEEKAADSTGAAESESPAEITEKKETT